MVQDEEALALVKQLVAQDNPLQRRQRRTQSTQSNESVFNAESVVGKKGGMVRRWLRLCMTDELFVQDSCVVTLATGNRAGHAAQLSGG